MEEVGAVVWRCGGVGWPEAVGPALLRWEGGRTSSLALGREIGFRAEGERRCVGARGHACPVRAVVPARATQARCAECARLDRAFSVAADGVPDDPRPYRVYLAWFGPGTVKVGITAEERGGARLREQGALAYAWLGRGPLMAARRTEELLRAALGVPDRVPYARKRVLRSALPPVGERAGEVVRLHGRALALGGWAEALEPLECRVVDHAELFGLDGLPAPGAVVRELVDGGVVAGRLVAVAGPDLHLRTPGDGSDDARSGGRIVILDTRLMTGWALTATGPGGGGEAGAPPGAGVGVPVTEVERPVPGEQGGLF